MIKKVKTIKPIRFKTYLSIACFTFQERLESIYVYGF